MKQAGAVLVVLVAICAVEKAETEYAARVTLLMFKS